VLPKLDPQGASNIFWSCARLSLNPDSAVPGLTAKLLSTEARGKRAVAQDLSNTVWAVATLKDAGQLAHVDMVVVRALCASFMAFVNSHLANKPVNSQEISNLLWAAATLDLRLDAIVLDKLCAYTVHLTQQPSAQTSVGAQNVADALWLFYKMRHQPNPDQLSCLLAHFDSLSAVQGRQPNSQSISNAMLAMAGLGLEQSRHILKNLGHRLLGANLNLQDLSNAVWSLAMLNVLDTHTFKLFWTVIGNNCSDEVPAEENTQLYQALYRLQPHPYALTWQKLRQELEPSDNLISYPLGSHQPFTVCFSL